MVFFRMMKFSPIRNVLMKNLRPKVRLVRGKTVFQKMRWFGLVRYNRGMILVTRRLFLILGEANGSKEDIGMRNIMLFKRKTFLNVILSKFTGQHLVIINWMSWKKLFIKLTTRMCFLGGCSSYSVYKFT